LYNNKKESIVKNPFFLREIALDDPFCDRVDELKALCRHARSVAYNQLLKNSAF